MRIAYMTLGNRHSYIKIDFNALNNTGKDMKGLKVWYSLMEYSGDIEQFENGDKGSEGEEGEKYLIHLEKSFQQFENIIEKKGYF